MTVAVSWAVEVVRQLLRDVAAVVPDGDRATIDRLGARLGRTPTVAAVGRVSSGKSTLVNALVGARVAATDAGECTKVATMYEFGAPERFEIVGFDGSVTRTAGRAPAVLPRAIEAVDFAIAYTPQACLRDRYRVVDTPGLSSHEPEAEAATRRALLVDDGGLPRPEVVVFLVEGGSLRSDEVEFLREAGASRLNTVLVISRADTAGDGVLGVDDPFAVAGRQAERLLIEHGEFTTTVLPVAGLMAEGVEAGVSESDAAALAALSGVDEFDLFAMADGGDRTVSDLTRRIGFYGVVHGRDVAADGAIALSDWLMGRSGLVELHRELAERFRRSGPLLTVKAVVDKLRGVAVQSEARDEILTLVERAESDSRLHGLREVEALDRLAKVSPRSPLVAELDTVVRQAGDRFAILGVAGDAGPAELWAAGRARIADCRARRLTAFSGVEREALIVLERSYQLAMPKEQR